MSSPALSPLESRILGCLLEKERLTPENYPLSLNGLTNACNQSTNREPVTAYDEKAVQNGLDTLREKKLASVLFGAGSRVQKYRHRLLEHYELNPAETALLCILLLRGPQTSGELRTRTERLHAFDSVAAVEARLTELARGDSPLVRLQPTRPGQKEPRWVQLLSDETTPVEESPGSFLSQVPTPPAQPPSSLASEIATLRAELQQLREEFQTFRKQFEP